MNERQDTGVTVAEAAKLVNVSPATIYVWVHRGQLTPIPGTKPMQFWSGDVFTTEAERWKNRGPGRPATTGRGSL